MKAIPGPQCRASGKTPIGNICAFCDGRAKVPIEDNRTERCPPCRGSGKTPLGSACSVCCGYGLLIPAFAEENELRSFVYSVKAGEPRKAQEALNEIFQVLSGTVSICDPYFGVGTLVRLNLLQHCRPIRFLTRHLDKRNAATLAHEMAEWRQEHCAVEFKSTADDSVHDRFVLSSSELVILGHGLKDIGKKDSFVIKIGRELAGDVVDSVQSAFDEKWQNATIIV